MAVRLVVTITAAPGKGAELAQVYKARCAEAQKEPGCEQFEIFQSVANPDRLALLERWPTRRRWTCTPSSTPRAPRSARSYARATGSARTTSTTGPASCPSEGFLHQCEIEAFGVALKPGYLLVAMLLVKAGRLPLEGLECRVSRPHLSRETLGLSQ